MKKRGGRKGSISQLRASGWRASSCVGVAVFGNAKGHKCRFLHLREDCAGGDVLIRVGGQKCV